MAENKAFLLFTSEDMGAVFTDEVFCSLLQDIAALMRDANESWRIPQRYQLIGLGLPPNHETTALARLAGENIRVYVLEHHQYTTINDLLYTVDCYLNGPVEGRKLPAAAPTQPAQPPVPPVETGPQDFTEKHTLYLLADQLRYRQKTPVLTDTQRAQITGSLDRLVAEGNVAELTRMVAKLDELELKTVAPTRAAVIKELDNKCRILLSHAAGVPDSWRTTMVPRLSDALQRTDEPALQFLQETLRQLLQFHFESLDGPQLRSLYEVKYGAPE